MKAIFKNIGPITEAEMELGDLTIIAGQNNTGKTYLAYTLYGFLSGLREQIYAVMSPPRALSENGVDVGKAGVKKVQTKVGKIAKTMEKSGQATISIAEYADLRMRILRVASAWFSCNLSDVFSVPKRDFIDAEFELWPPANLAATMDKADTAYRNSIVGITASIRGDTVVFTLDDSPEHSVSGEAISHLLFFWIAPGVLPMFPKPFILSAERFGISLFYKELDFAKNRLVEELQKLADGKRRSAPLVFLGRESARYAKPISDNINFTRDLTGEQPDEPDGLGSVRLVEAMVNGRYKATDEEIRFLSKARVRKGKFNLPLHLASSSARGLSDLYFYLQNDAEPGQLLIIDEPESHLSPRNQILMARLLAFCVRAGLKVLVTTHSDYLVKEFNNLIMLHGEFAGKKKFLSWHKKEYSADDGLNPEAVRAYTCADGTLHRCKVGDMGMDMPVFDEAIDAINRVSNQLAYFKAGEDS